MTNEWLLVLKTWSPLPQFPGSGSMELGFGLYFVRSQKKKINQYEYGKCVKCACAYKYMKYISMASVSVPSNTWNTLDSSLYLLQSRFLYQKQEKTEHTK